MNPTEVFATGVSGTIGSHLSSNIRSIRLDLSSPKLEKSVLEGISGASVIHLAAKVGHLDSKLPQSSKEINVNGTLQLAEQCLEAQIEKFIYVSSAHVYKPSVGHLFENSEIEPISEYGEQKALAEQELMHLFAMNQDKLVIIRVFSVLDFGMKPKTLGGKIERIIMHNSDEIIENSDDVRDFLTPKTVAVSLEKIANFSNLSGVYNLCTGNGLSVKLASILMCPNEKTLSDDFFQSGVSRVPRIVGNNSKLLGETFGLNLQWSYASEVPS